MRSPPPRVRLQLNRHELRALLILIGRVRLTPIERLDLSDAIPELQRAVLAASRVRCHDSAKRVMTRRMAPKRVVWKRERGVPVQFYLSTDERGALRSIARQRKLSIAALIRSWIKRARPKTKRAPKPDRRQTLLFDAGPGSKRT